jgi:Arc/MetJ family transcription regulator
MIHMSRTTLNLDGELLKRAQEVTGITQKTAVIHEALRALIASDAAGRLALLGGSQPDLRPIPRRRLPARR